ncbi:protein of unknown function DUF551 [Vibrio phage 1.228.O._10N.261.49.C1]|nr:protein of unknown function DUF551 [Vibrio phage 1.228.O._10N.261.49.C1]
MKWINVKDELPSYGAAVLVCNQADQIFTCMRPVIEHNMSLIDTDTVKHVRYTHWMPLPKPPTED